MNFSPGAERVSPVLLCTKSCFMNSFSEPQAVATVLLYDFITCLVWITPSSLQDHVIQLVEKKKQL